MDEPRILSQRPIASHKGWRVLRVASTDWPFGIFAPDGAYIDGASTLELAVLGMREYTGTTKV